MKHPIKSTILLCMAAGILIGAVLKLFVVDVLHIEGSSMEPALSDGGAVLVSKLAYGIVRPFSDSLLYAWKLPQERDIVIYMYNNATIIKRCVAVGGTPLEYSDDNGYTLIVNDNAYPLSTEQYYTMHNIVAVPADTILAIGDNYTVSIDSRDYGFIPVSNILGKALCK